MEPVRPRVVIPVSSWTLYVSVEFGFWGGAMDNNTLMVLAGM